MSDGGSKEGGFTVSASHFREVSLGDLAMAKEEEVLGVLYRGAIYVVQRIQIYAAKHSYAPWSQTLNSCYV